MIKKIIQVGIVAGVIILSGCAKKAPEPKKVLWETMEYKPKLEACSDIDKKYLKSYSFMQLVSELGSKEGVEFTFTPNSDDLFIDELAFRSWSDALFWLDQQKQYKVQVFGYATKNVIKTIEISKISPNFFEMVAESKIKRNSNGLVYSEVGRLRPSDEVIAYLQSFIDSYNMKNKYLTVERFFNDFYYYFLDATGKALFFEYEPKSKSLIISTTPKTTYLTPYKMRIFTNYLNANNIAYSESDSHDQVFIDDNFLLWKKAQIYLASLKRYKNHIYGIKTDEGYYEIADSTYPAKPLAVELITWTPYGEREYNIYYNGKSHKVITKERDFSFFSQDTHKKFTIRTY